MYENQSEYTMLKVVGTGIIIIIIIFVILALSPFTIIGAGERGVVTKFGNVQDVILDEGIHFKMPIQDSVIRMDVKVQKDEAQESAASRDLQTVSATVAVNWHLDPKKVNVIYQSVGGKTDVVERIIKPFTQEAIKASTAKMNAEELITKRSILKQAIDQELEAQLTPYNIILDGVSIVNLSFSPEFDAAIEQKAKAEQEALKAQNDLKRIEFEAQQKVVTAKAEAEAISIKGDALENNPLLVELEAIKTWNGVLPVNMYGSAPVPFINISQ